MGSKKIVIEEKSEGKEQFDDYNKYYYEHKKRSVIIVIIAETREDADSDLRDLVALPFMWRQYDTVKMKEEVKKNE